MPVACLDGNIPKALTRAPAQVSVDGTKLSDCFTRVATPAEVQEVGAIFIRTAEQLAPQARSKPHSPAATRLGYLIGAMRRGTNRTQGIHYETRRRIELELNGVNTRTREFVTGERAGEKSG